MTLTTDELTDLLNEDAAERIKARTLANIARRAETLLQDGYTCRLWLKGRQVEPLIRTRDIYLVTTPNDDEYQVSLSETPNASILGDHCNCPCFDKWGECKHHLAVLNFVWEAEQVRQCEEHDALYTDADDDRYAEY